MRDLIARLEAAQGPDPELCALAVAAVVGGTVKRSPINGRWCVYVGTDHRGEPRLWEPRGAKWNDIQRALLNDRGPTASLDAALTLVPEGVDVEVYFSPREKPHRRGCVVLTISRQVYEAHAATPALAVVIAALHARAAEGGPR